MKDMREKTTDKKHVPIRRKAKKAIAFVLAVLMVVNMSTTPVEAFSLGGLFKKISNSVSSTVNSIRNLTDSSSSKTVYSYSELNKFLSNLFSPKNIKVKLGADIVVPSNRNIVSVLHNVDMDMNGHTIYSDNPSQTFFISYGRTFNVKNGKIVQRVSNSSGIVHMLSGDATFENVTFRKYSGASRVTGLCISGIGGQPAITLKNVTMDGLTTGMSVMYSSRVTMSNSTMKNMQGDAIATTASGSYKPSVSLSSSTIKYTKGNGVNACKNATVKLTDVTITGGTSRNRYGVLAAKGSDVTLSGNSKVYSNAGGNIGVYKDSPVTIQSVTSNNRYSFTVVDGLNDKKPHTVAKLNAGLSNNVRTLPVSSDISRYTMIGAQGATQIQIQNPPEQCNVNVTVAWKAGTKALDTSKDSNYATVSVNGGAEGETGAVIVKYDKKVTLSTTNKNPERYQFVGWEKYVNENPQGIVSTNPVCQIDAIDENVTYKAVYQYKEYKITVKSSGKGSVTCAGAISQNGNDYVFYVDDSVTLTAKANAGNSNANYAFKKWNDGVATATRTFTVNKDETYTAMFKKTGQTTGTMYLDVKQLTSTSQISSGTKLLLIYVGGDAKDNKLETSSGNVGITGLPDNSAKITALNMTSSHGRSAATAVGPDGINGYGTNVTPKTSMLYVDAPRKDHGAGFDTCEHGYIEYYTYTNQKGQSETSWLYWCDAGGVNAAGPYALYSYSNSLTFEMNAVKIQMKDDFNVTREEQEVDNKSAISVYVTVNGTRYDLGGLKFKADDLDNKINYKDGDKLINFELDGVPVDYTFPEATVGGKQYTTLSEAINAAQTSGDTINIVGPGVDAIDAEHKVSLKDGVKIKGYDGETVTSVGDSTIGVDKDGMVRLLNGELEVSPEDTDEVSIGVKDAYATTDKKIHVKTDENGNSYIVPEFDGTKLTISPDNNPEHMVEITNTKEENEYGFNNLKSYEGETVKIGKETEYAVNLPGSDEESESSSVKTSKYNTGETIIEPGASEDGNSKPTITSSQEGDKVTVGDNTYTTGKTEDGEVTKYQVNPDQSQSPSVVLEKGTLGIPKGTSVETNGQIIHNTGATGEEETEGSNPVQIGASGEIEIPDGAGITIGDKDDDKALRIEVPHATPMNGNTKVNFEDGEPVIRTSGNSEVKLVIDGEETTYKVGDYDSKLTIGDDGIPVIEDGDILLQPGQSIKDRMGNEYKLPDDADPNDSIKIMTTPLVYETDDDGNPVTDENGEPVVVGGGDMSFVIPENKSIECKPEGSKDFQSFENPGSGEGFFNLDPEKAKDGIQADSKLGLAPGKELQVNVGDKSVSVTAPETASGDNITVDGSTGDITLKNPGTVLVDKKIYETTEDNTILRATENGVELSDGKVKLHGDAPVIAEGLKINKPASGKGTVWVQSQESSGSGEGAPAVNTDIQTSGVTEFTVAPVGEDNASIAFVTDDGAHTYQVSDDGTLGLKPGDTIKRKYGATTVTIENPNESDISLKPLSKPDKDTISSGESSPASGLLIEVPTGGTVKIGNTTYTESQLDNGRKEESEELPLQLVLDDNKNVILHSGTVELDKDAAIVLYDVANEKATFTNKSEGDRKVQVTNPGIVTMDKAGAKVTITEKGKNTTFASTEDDTQIAYTPYVCMLKRGGVELGKNDRILVSDVIIQNTSSGGSVSVSMKEETKTVTNGNGSQEEVFVHTGTIDVPNGGSFEASYPGSEYAITYQSNQIGGEGTSRFTMNEDGNIVLPNNGIVTLKDGKGNKTDIQAQSENIESIPTPDGAIFAIPTGGSLVVDGKKYTNSGEEELVLSVNRDGKVVLEQGKVDLSEGAVVYVKNEKQGLVPIQNKETEEEGTTKDPITVSYNGPTEIKDEDDKVTGITYPNVEIQVPSGNEFGIGNNDYTNTEPTGGTSGSPAAISLDITDDDEAGKDGNVSGGKILLKSGAVEMGAGSSISIQNSPTPDDKKILTNTGEKSGEDIRVSSDGQLELTNNSAVKVEGTDGTTTIEVPEQKEGDESYKAKVDLSDSGNDKTTVEIVTEDGNGTSGANKTVIIDDGTYTSNEEDKNLKLELSKDTWGNDRISLSDQNQSVDLSSGASLVVGETTVTAITDPKNEDEKITVTEDTAEGSTKKVPKVEIPAGGEVNFKNPSNDQNIDVKVPQQNEEDGQEGNRQEFKIGEDGSVSTELKKDEKVVIGGVEYTGTSQDESGSSPITVNGKTGELETDPSSTSNVSVAIDAEKFNKPDYKFTVPAGGQITVDDVIYQAGDSPIALLGNPDGNPIVEIENADGTVGIGDKTYTAVNAKSRFSIDRSGEIALADNQNEQANSSLKLSGTSANKVNGITYSGSKTEDSYIVIYNSDGCAVEVADGSKISVNMPKDAQIYVAGKGAVETTDESGKRVTETFVNRMPIVMQNGSGSILLDKTNKGYTDTAYVTVSGKAQMTIDYVTDPATGEKTMKSITIRQPDPVSSDSESDKKDNSITVTDSSGKDISVTVSVKEDKIVIDTITKEMVENIVSDDKKGKVALDCSSIQKNVVEVNVDTVVNIAEKAQQLKIITHEAELTLDKKAIEVIMEEAEGNTIEIKAGIQEIDNLNEQQKETLKNYNVKSCLDAYVESNGVRIHDFKTGVVRVGMPWKIEKGKKAVYYHIYYLDPEGSMEAYDTVYEDGKLWFETGHFSEYVVVYDKDSLNATPIDQTPLLAQCTKTGKNTLRLKWNKVKGADKYTIYLAKYTGSKSSQKMKKIAAVSATKTSYEVKDLKAGTGYRIVVQALSKGKVINKSVNLYVTTKGGTKNNASNLKTSTKTLSIAQGKKKRIKVSCSSNAKSLKYGGLVRFVSSNPEVTSVDKSGKITAKHSGTCYVYAFLNSGKYVKIKVIVK